jgi:hypothetical protein
VNYSLSKRVCSDEILVLAWYSVKHVKKDVFILASKRAFDNNFSAYSIHENF